MKLDITNSCNNSRSTQNLQEGHCRCFVSKRGVVLHPCCDITPYRFPGILRCLCWAVDNFQRRPKAGVKQQTFRLLRQAIRTCTDVVGLEHFWLRRLFLGKAQCLLETPLFRDFFGRVSSLDPAAGRLRPAAATFSTS